MKRIILAATLSVSLFALGACGHSTADRGLSGAGLGAAAGLGIGALTGAPVAGAVIGGVAGGAAGILTNSDQVNLGKPIWR
jgi:osmotically inducible lipoprotein OsmB